MSLFSLCGILFRYNNYMATRLDLALTFLGDLEDTLLYVWDELRHCRESLRRHNRNSDSDGNEGRIPVLLSLIESCSVDHPVSSVDPEHDDDYLCSYQVRNLIRYVRERVYHSMDRIEGGLNHTQVLCMMMDMDLESSELSSLEVASSSTASTCDTLCGSDTPGARVSTLGAEETMSP